MSSQRILKLLYGEEKVKKINNSNVLIVGAGGIGCELVKNLTKSGFRRFSIIDLDTIEFSNLNRQFYFRKEHVKQSKADVTKQKVLEICPDAQIESHYANLFEEQFNNSFYQKFDLVFCALDNQEARRYLGRKCIENNLLMVDAGTSGFTGNVNTAIRQENECNNCKPAARTQTFNICSIRNKPSETIHCVVWAKNLFNLIFGPQESEDIEIEKEEDEDREVEESQNQLESGTIGGVFEKALNSYQEDELEQLGAKLFDKLFFSNIQEQDVTQYHQENAQKQMEIEIQGVKVNQKTVTSTLKPVKYHESNTLRNIPNNDQKNVQGKADDQIIKNLSDYANDFVRNFVEIVKLEKSQIGFMKYDKDDKRCLQFVTAATNFRVYNFRSDKDPKKLEYISARKIKEMNIIHAIGSTNAIVAAIQTTESIKVLDNQLQKLNYYKIANNLNDKIVPIKVKNQQAAKMNCEACGYNNIYVYLQANFKLNTLEQIIQVLKKEFYLPDTFSFDIKNSDGSCSTYQKPVGEQLNPMDKKRLQLYQKMINQSIFTHFSANNQGKSVAQIKFNIFDSQFQWILEIINNNDVEKIQVFTDPKQIQENIKGYKILTEDNKYSLYQHFAKIYGY